MLTVEITQHPVGQGGLLSGTIDFDGTNFRWVYDCGSNQIESLHRELGQLSPDIPINLLLISHLDSDHISGLDRLLLRFSVTEAVMPYLTENDMLLALAREVSDGTLSTSFTSFALNPVRWLTSRGVSVVTFLEPFDDGDVPDGEGLPEGPRGFEEGTTRAAIIPQWSVQPEVDGRRAQRISKHGALRLLHNRSTLDWVIVPHAHRPRVERLVEFRRALNRALHGRISLRATVEALRNPEGRTKIRACYDALWSNHNLVSMACYFGPGRAVPNDGMVTWWAECSSRKRGYIGTEAGWISTGDADLSARSRRTALLSRYRSFIGNVGVIVLPHHGADSNYGGGLVESFPRLHLGVAASGKNRYGHPGAVVKRALRDAGHDFARVSEKGRSVVRLQARLRP